MHPYIGVNLFVCFLVGKTSAVTYQVVGHLKTVIILGGGYFFFDHETSGKVFLGGFVAMLGCIAYGVVKNRDLNKQ